MATTALLLCLLLRIRCRLIAQVYGFAENDADINFYRGELLDELHLFKKEYEALMYGGTIMTLVSILK
jgi:hypothetical protein